MKQATILSAMLCLIATATAWAEPIIFVGDHFFSPGETRTIALYASGEDSVLGLNFYIQLGDGGAGNGGSAVYPRIVDVDVVGDARDGVGPATLFFGNNTEQSNDFTSDLLWAVSVTTDAGEVVTSDSRTLAFVTIDTTGMSIGETCPICLKGVAEGIFGALVDSDFAGIGASITNGSISVVPEPSGALILGCVLTLLLPAVYRRRVVAAARRLV